MDINNKSFGKELLYILPAEGAPWSVGTLAIIAGLGLRLINLSLINSEYEGYNTEIKELFSLCDQDIQLFADYLEHQAEQGQLNKVPVQLLELLIPLHKELLAKNYLIKENLKIDFRIGIDIINLCISKTTSIIMENNKK